MRFTCLAKEERAWLAFSGSAFALSPSGLKSRSSALVGKPGTWMAVKLWLFGTGDSSAEQPLEFCHQGNTQAVCHDVRLYDHFLILGSGSGDFGSSWHFIAINCMPGTSRPSSVIFDENLFSVTLRS
jgi:hypothetical protein